jgi:hypothetical protein
MEDNFRENDELILRLEIIMRGFDKKVIEKIIGYNNIIDKRNKKERIPVIIRRLVWNTYIGEERGKGKCYCCEEMDISQLNFICGHVISENKGGKITIDNLRPICLSCNLSMGTRDMYEFKRNYFSKLL